MGQRVLRSPRRASSAPAIQRRTAGSRLGPHISISGVESSPHTFIRFVSALNDVGPTLGNENEAVQKIVDGIVIYKFAENYHALYDRWWLKYNPMTYHVWLMHHEGMIHWRYGREALQNLDIKWAEMHNEVLSYTQTGSYDYWVDCTGGGIFYPSYHDLETMFRTVEQYQCDNRLIDGYWATRYYTYTVSYQDQTDGFIPKNRTQWNNNEGFVASTTTASAVRQGNISFDGANEADAGYNHLELRFHKRDNGSATPTRSTPNRFAQDWAKEWFGVN